jgi:ferredoxin
VAKYIYLVFSRCLIVPTDEKDPYAAAEELLKVLSHSVESIRYVDERGCKYIFLRDNLATQLEITNDFIGYVRKFLENIQYAGGIKGEREIELPLMKPLTISPSLTKRLQNEVIKCTRCGLCLSACPMYAEKRDEVYSPRGLISLLIESKSEMNEVINIILKYCTKYCGKNKPACEDVCPTGVSFSNILNELQKEREHDR